MASGMHVLLSEAERLIEYCSDPLLGMSSEHGITCLHVRHQLEHNERDPLPAYRSRREWYLIRVAPMFHS
jgi:hypothetical protein